MIRSTQNHHRAAWTALATAGAVCMALTLVPAAAAQDVIDVRAGAAAIDFEPTFAHGGLVLTVSGPDGFYHREEFGAGESASFSIFDQDGGALPDGSYTWELTAAPTDVQRREALEANRLESRSQTQGITPVVESGSFAVIGGSLVAGGDQEPGAEQPAAAAPEGSNTLATKDFVINDDLIVTGSQCLGFDCVNGETFGFDTLRLKENNTRIKFEDTSTVSGFPTNDWELVANDSASGGLSRFSIRDVDSSRNVFTVEANAPSNALYVESSGDVGVGTSNPVLDLHVSTGNSPGLRLEQNTSSGFQAQIFDIAGNEANFFVRDTTNGSRLPFRIRPGAPTSSIDIAANGNVGIGTTSPDAKLHVDNGSVQVTAGDVVVREDDDGNEAAVLGASNTRGTLELLASGGITTALNRPGGISFMENNLGLEGCQDPDHDLVIGGTGAGCNTGTFSEIDAGEAQFTISSSRKIKENLNPLKVEEILKKVAAVGVYSYDFKDGPDDRIGLMAEDFHQVFGRGSEKMLSGHEVQLAMWLAIQELIAENGELRREMEEFRADQ